MYYRWYAADLHAPLLNTSAECFHNQSCNLAAASKCYGARAQCITKKNRRRVCGVCVHPILALLDVYVRVSNRDLKFQKKVPSILTKKVNTEYLDALFY